MKLSAPEKRLLDFAHKQFGEHLSQFLLAGLGEEKAGQRGHFTITYNGGENVALKRRVQVITYEPTDGTSYLPQSRNPLVLVALLHLLTIGNRRSLYSLRYEQAELLSLLGWNGSRKARREIDEAEERYFLLTYQWKMNKSELLRNRLTSFTADEAMIAEYESIDTADEKSARVVFNEHFIDQLLNRSLFGIDWNSIRSISRRCSSKKQAGDYPT